MPSAAHVAWAKFRVAAMIGCAVGILAVVIYLLLGGSDALEPTVTVRTYMIDLQGLAKGAPVRFNGIRVGEVTATSLSHVPDPQKVVRVDMKMMRKFLPAIPEDSTVAVAADTLLGDKFADINEGKSPRHLQPDAVLLSPPPKAINNADLLKAAREIVSRVDSVFADIEAGRGQVGQLVKGEEFYNRVLQHIQIFERDIRSLSAKDSAAGQILYQDTLYEDLRKPIQKLNQLLGDLQAGQGPGGPFLKDSAQYDNMRKSIQDLNRSLDDLNAGKGPVGKVLKDDELYLQVNRIINEVDTQVEALNSGEGAVGHLMVSSDLYESLQGSTGNLRNMLRELRKNPQKFLRLKVF